MDKYKDSCIAIIGAGSVGTEVIKALYQNGHRKIIATNIYEDGLAEINRAYPGIKTTTDNVPAVQQSDLVVLTLKPYIIEGVCEEVKEYTHNKLVISLAAAKSLERIEYILDKSRVARAMTGVFVSDEVAAYTLGSLCRQDDGEAIKYIFGPDAREVKEEVLAARTWIACDTGLIPKSLEAKVQKLVELGMAEEDVMLFYATTLEAIAKALRSGTTLDEIYQAVAGPGSFTERMFGKLQDKGYLEMLKECVEETVKACRKE